jgi:hypothetical protein
MFTVRCSKPATNPEASKPLEERLLDFNLALRDDARRDPPEKGEARAGSERTSSRWTQIAKQNRSAGEPAPTGLFKPHLKNWSAVKLAALKGLRGGARGDQDSVRPSDEHAIWRSEVRRGEGSRGTGTRSAL